jgi:hypothetical protein
VGASLPQLVQLSSDPYTNAASQHHTEVEPDSFSYGATIVTAFQAGRFSDGGSSNIGWATSTDGGASWQHGFLPGITIYAGGSWSRVSDPSVAYDRVHNVWIIASLALSTSSGNVVGAAVLVSRSTDGGRTWANPVTVSTVPSGGWYDKDWLVCDSWPAPNPKLGIHTGPSYGHCYLEWDDANLNLIYMSTSTDGGHTWSARNGPSPNTGGIGGQPIILRDGVVVVPILVGGVNDFVSTNGGASWSKVYTIASLPNHIPAGSLRGVDLPSAEVDGAGRLYLVWPTCRYEANCSANDLEFSTTLDGVTWTPVQRIPLDPIGSGVDHFLPSIAVDTATSGSTAHLGVAYYYYPVANCTVSTCQLDVGFASSADGGATWSARTQLAGPLHNTWLANTTQGYMVGDYFSASFAKGTVYPIFAVATAPSGSTFNETMVTVAGGLSILGGTLPARRDPILVNASTPRPTRLN